MPRTGAASVPSPSVRATVRDLLAASDAYHAQDPDTRRAIASSLVRIAHTAKALADEHGAPVLAQAQNAGSEFSGVAANRVADTTHQILNAVSFPRFVTELINGVFKALNDSNQQQLHSYVELIQNVAASTEGFADANVGISGARSWLAERFPANFVVQGAETDDFATPAAQMTPDERAEAQAERDAATRLALRPGASMPTAAAIRTALSLGPQDSVPTGDPESLVPVARANLARNRQQMLSTMVMMGLQRIVIESGRLNASMRFHIDTRSAAADDRGSSFDEHNDSSANVGAKFGPWGVDAKVQNTIGYVSTQRTQTTEEMNTDLDLNSSVELIFKTDYVALDRLAGGPAQERIRVNALNPEAEERLASSDRQARRTAQGSAESTRAGQLSDRLGLSPRPTPAPAASSAPKGSTTTPAASTGSAPTSTGSTGTSPSSTGTAPTSTTGTSTSTTGTAPTSSSGTSPPPSTTGSAPSTSTGSAPSTMHH